MANVHGYWSMARGLQLLALATLLLTACGSSGITQTGQTDRYKVQLALDGTGFGERTANVEINDLGGQPVTADQVVLAPVMREMGMAAPEVTAQSLAPGRYQAKGQLFVMNGTWEIAVRVSAGGVEDVARFKITVAQQ